MIDCFNLYFSNSILTPLVENLPISVLFKPQTSPVSLLYINAVILSVVTTSYLGRVG